MRNKYLTNSLWIISGKAIQALLALIVGALTARYLGPSNYGTINYVAAYITFFSCVANLGMNSTAVNEILSSPNEVGKTIGTMTLAKFISSNISALFVITIVAIVDKGEQTTVIVAAIYSSYLVFQSFQTFEYWYQARLQSKITALIGVFAYIAMSVYKVILLLAGANIYWFAFSMSVDVMIISIGLLVVYKSQGGPKLGVSWQHFKKIFVRSRPFILAGLIQVIYTKTDTIMLKHMFDSAEVGVYTCASTLVGFGSLILAAVTDSTRPLIITAKKQDQELYSRRVRQVFCVIFIIGALLALALTVGSKLIVHIIYGSQYKRSVLPLIVLSWNSVLIYLTTARNIWIVCEDKQKYTIIFCLLGAIVNILANVLLIPCLGAFGAAIGTMIAQIVSGFIAPCIFKETREIMKYLGEGVRLKNTLTDMERLKIKNKIKGLFKRK